MVFPFRLVTPYATSSPNKVPLFVVLAFIIGFADLPHTSSLRGLLPHSVWLPPLWISLSNTLPAPLLELWTPTYFVPGGQWELCRVNHQRSSLSRILRHPLQPPSKVGHSTLITTQNCQQMHNMWQSRGQICALKVRSSCISDLSLFYINIIAGCVSRTRM